MGGFVRPDLQTLLAQAPNGTPDMPVFEEGAIPPVFGPQFPDPQELVESTIEMPVSEELGPVSVGQPVPPVKESRGDRLRALLGNFLQNFGTGLQAAARAPSGAGFAAGFGAALSAPEERRQQQAREGLLRENQKFRQQISQQQQEAREEALAIQEQSRLDRQTDINRQRIFRREGRTQLRFRDILESRTRKREKEESRTFLKGQQKERLDAIAEQGKLTRKLKRELADQPGTEPLTIVQALTQARLEVAEVTKADALKLGKDRLFVGEEGLKRLQQVINERATELLGRKATLEETKEIFDPAKVTSVLADIERAREADFTDDDLTALVVRFFLAGEINSLEQDKIMEEAGLAPESVSEVELFRRNIGRRERATEAREVREKIRPARSPSFTLPALPRR